MTKRKSTNSSMTDSGLVVDRPVVAGGWTDVLRAGVLLRLDRYIESWCVAETVAW